MKTLVVVDVQHDFASPDGALYVKGSEIIANKVLEVIKDFDHVVFTLDFHPINHCSFVENGGIWPAHCVAYTEGTAYFDGGIRYGEILEELGVVKY